MVEGVDIPAERVFAFTLPLTLTGTGSFDPVRILMLVGATMAAMLLTCTPCLVGSLTVGSLTMGSAWSSDSEETAKKIRGDMVKQTLYYLPALVIASAAVAVAASAFNISIEDIRPVELMGGVLLMIVGISFLRSSRPVIWLENAVVQLLIKLIPGFTQFVSADEPKPGLGTGSSMAMGAS